MKNQKFYILIIVLSLLILTVSCGEEKNEVSSENIQKESSKSEMKEESKDIEDYSGKKILYVDSYKDDYPWSKALSDSFSKIIDKTNAEYKIVRMDTKNNTSEEFKVEAGNKVKAIYDEYKPDVVIGADDNASKYFIVPFLKNSETPVVVIGVNWNGDSYGYPFENTTGLYEVSPFKQTLDQLKQYSKGDKIAFISGDNATAKIDSENMKKEFNVNFEKEYYCKTYEEFVNNYKKLQDEVDMFYFNNTGSSIINGWEDQIANEFIENNTKIPSCTTYEWVTPYTLLGVTTVPKEHGDFAANTALEILGGKNVSEIPFSKNKEGSLYLNQKIAEKLSITFNANILKGAKIVK
ncbi:MAG: ABC transporter substrate binding protein [Clostridiales bacterium]